MVVRHSGAYLGTDKASGRRRSMYIITGPISKQAETRSRDRVPKPCREQAWPVQTVLEYVYVYGACFMVPAQAVSWIPGSLEYGLEEPRDGWLTCCRILGYCRVSTQYIGQGEKEKVGGGEGGNAE